MKSTVSLLIPFVLASIAHGAELSFNREVRPILSDKCFACHGFDPKTRKADRRLDTFEGATAEIDGVRAIVPGDVQASEAWLRIVSDDADEVMPPPKSHKKLTATEKATLRRWIEQGAKYEPHWAFVKIAPVPAPEVKRADWPRSALDRFILARLEAEGLAPSAEAERETLIRRVTLDLTGLPPTIAEVDAFLADASPTALEKVVDRLLASPHYGERMAVDWLDAARFADTNGYQVDRDRELWPWREWVVGAFNRNLPFDQFTIEQLAGDLLPNPTLEQRVATGFHRNHMLNEEGGIIAEEFLAEYTADRVETTAAVWLGQTFNCARCHDHKYDPFTQRDFYAMKAFFHNVPERGVGIYSNHVRVNAPPFMKLPAPEVEAKIAGLNAKVKALDEQIAALSGASSAGLGEWAQRLASTTVKWEPIEIVSATGGDAPPSVDVAARVVEVGPQETRANTIKITARLPAGRITALQLECATTASAASVQWSELKLLRAASAGKKGQPVKLRATVDSESMAATELSKVLDNNRRTRTAVAARPERTATAIFELEKAVELAEPEEVEIDLGVENANGPARWRVLISAVDPKLLAPKSVRTIATKEEAKRTPAEKKQLAAHRLSQHTEHRKLTDQLAALKKDVAAAELEIPTTLVMEEQKEPRPTFVLMRGAYDKPSERVNAATPAVLPALADDQPRDRLGLARWLVSAENPLTARVIVNRFWQQVFGAGLVKTSEDFGAQGDAPSHPELLDWLAGEFMRSGWDVKRLMKLMVTSATYRQQSRLTPALRERDPENRLLARGPRFRLPAEMVRDQALAASGLLVRKIGGPSVKPYHPPGLYEQVVAQRDNPQATYTPGKGDDLHRRSLYTYWKRSVPHPGMMIFDAPFRETCTLRRTRSNTPLQALNLMNDPTYVEASRFLAQRMIREGGADVEGRLVHGFRLLLARAPKAAELAVLRASHERAQAEFERDEEASMALLAVGESPADATLNPAELAAFTTVASTLLNLDEVVTKE
jgi:hypothetical protein